MNTLNIKLLIFTYFLWKFVAPLSGQLFIGSTEIETRDVATNLYVPWEILWGPDDFIWATERSGAVLRINPETGQKHTLIDISDAYNFGEGGLLGMVLHPDFGSYPHVFLSYSYENESSQVKERVVKYVYSDNSLNSPEILIDNINGAGNHNGSRLVIDPADLTLYVTTGDAANTGLPQDVDSPNGKILRLELDGSIPDDNPIAGNPVWSWGHRNPQGLVLAPNGIMYSSEHGPSTDDEVNIIEKGRNYGWPTVKGFCDQPSEEDFCADSNVFEPLIAWTPTLAVAGLDYYNHDAISEWKGKLLLTSLKESDLRSLNLSPDGRSVTGSDVWFNNEYGRLRDLCISPDGRVFIATSTRDGRGSPTPVDDRIIEIKAKDGLDIASKKMEEWIIHPNPVSGYEVDIHSEFLILNEIRLFDYQGKLIYHVKDLNSSHFKLKIPDLTGVYLLEISSGTNTSVVKLVKL